MAWLPPVTWLALAFAAGAALAVQGASTGSAPAALLLPMAPILAWRSPLSLRLGLAAAALAGSLGALAAVRGQERSCLWRIAHRAEVTVHGHFAGRPGEGAAPFLVASGLEPGCASPVVVRAVVRDGEAIPAVAEPVTAEGRWLRASAPRGPSPLGAGVLVLSGLAIGHVSGPPPLSLRVRGAAHQRIARLFPQRRALVEALVLARKEGLAPEVRERWALTGTAHLLAISGFHVGVVAGVLYLLTRIAGVPPARAPLAAALGAWIYVLAIGVPLAASRAATILAALAVGRLTGRRVSPSGALAATCILMLCVAPASVGSVSFQLSFAGAAGLVLAGPGLRHRLRRAFGGRLPRPLTSPVASGIAATLATLPLVAWHFDRVSLVGIPATLVAGPLVAAAIPGVFVSLVLSWAWEPGARFLAGGTDLLLWAADRTIAAFAAIPAASVWVPRWWIVAAVAASALVPSGRTLLSRAPRRARAVMAVGLFGTLTLLGPVPGLVGGSGALELVFLDVGQGDAVALRTPRGRWLLVDAGPRGRRFDAGERVVVPYLRRRGVPGLELLVLTHPDLDHVGGARAVLDGLPVERVLDPASPAGRAAYLEAVGAARRGGVRWLVAEAGDAVELDGVRLDVLHPGGAAAAAATEEPNDQSVVLLVRYGDFSALLTGDAPAAVEEALVDAGQVPDLDVLKAGHHGSRTSSSWRLVESALPEVAVVSAGARNRYGHPHPEVVSRLERGGARVVRTDRQGHVRVRVTRSGAYTVRLQRPGGGRP